MSNQSWPEALENVDSRSRTCQALPGMTRKIECPDPLPPRKPNGFKRIVHWIRECCSKTKTACQKKASRTHEKIKNEWLHFKMRNHHARELEKLKWFIVLGEPGSGKKSTLANSGLNFVNQSFNNPEAARYKTLFPDYDWWFSDEAIFTDTLSYDEDRDFESWKTFLKHLKRKRTKKPIDGILLTMSISSLMNKSAAERQSWVLLFCKQWRTLHELFHTRIPVYIIFTHADQVEGFMETFSDLSKEELQQVWGITFPLHQPLNFHAHYHALIAQLRKRVPWSFDTERRPHGRELINNFPQECQLLKKPIETFLGELDSAMRHPYALQLRGFYFISNCQTGNTHSYLQPALSRKFELSHTRHPQTKNQQESYFLKRLLPDVIFLESKFVGDNPQSLKQKKLLKKVLKFLMPLSIVTTMLLFYWGFQQEEKNVRSADNAVSNFQDQLEQTQNNHYSSESLAPLFSTLQSTQSSLSNESHWPEIFLLAHDELNYKLDRALQRSLQSYLLPKVAMDLESTLNQAMDDNNVLYADFKAYLAFDAHSPSNDSAVLAPMAIYWSQQFKAQPDLNETLNHDLKISLENPIEKLPLDQALIDRLRNQLMSIIPEDRAYALLSIRSNISNVSPINLRSMISKNFGLIFSNTDSSIPALYTQAGFQKIFLKEGPSIAQEVIDDNTAVGLLNSEHQKNLIDELKASMSEAYNQDYQAQWTDALNTIHINSFSNLPDAINKLSVLSSDDSPLESLLNMINENTSKIEGDKITINKNFESTNAFNDRASTKPTWNQTKSNLKKLKSYLETIQESPNPNKAAFNAAIQIIQNQSNPLKTFDQSIHQAPPFVQGWLQEISDNTWNTISEAAEASMDQAWHQDVFPEYQNNIAGHYPITDDPENSISIQNFNHFFAPGGTMNHVFTTLMKPFINITQSPWTLIQTNGHQLNISPDLVAQLEQTQKIQMDYFENHSTTASLHFSLTPNNLSEDSKAITLTVGDQTLSYRHGPQQSMDFNWPNNNQNSSLVLTSFNGSTVEHEANGPWSVFDILNRGQLTALGSSGNHRVNYHLGNYSASFLLSGIPDSRIISLMDFKGLKLPGSVKS